MGAGIHHRWDIVFTVAAFLGTAVCWIAGFWILDWTSNGRARYWHFFERSGVPGYLALKAVASGALYGRWAIAGSIGYALVPAIANRQTSGVRVAVHVLAAADFDPG